MYLSKKDDEPIIKHAMLVAITRPRLIVMSVDFISIVDNFVPVMLFSMHINLSVNMPRPGTGKSLQATI